MQEENNMRKTIESIDNAISKEIEELDKIVDELKFTKVHTFTLDRTTEFKLGKEFHHPGIYLFEIENTKNNTNVVQWMTNFTELWRDKKYHMRWTPGIKNHRVNSHTKLDGWIPLYIGKSRNIAKRIESHVFKELQKTTFAMKLKARENIYGITIRVSTINLDVVHYDMIVPYIENRLRNKLNPIAGKQ